MSEEIAEGEVAVVEAKPEAPRAKTVSEKGAMVEGVAEAQRVYANAVEKKRASEALAKACLKEEAQALEQLKAARLSLLKETE